MGYWGNRKPPFGTPLDRSHPLSQGLVFLFPFNEGAGNSAYDVVTPGGYNVPFVRQTSGNPWTYPGYLLPTTSDYAQTGSIPPAWKLQPPLSLVWQGNATAANASNTGSAMFGIIYSQPNGSPFNGPLFITDSGRGITMAYNRAGTFVQKLYNTVYDATVLRHQCVMAFGPGTVDGTNYVVGYYDGVSKATDSTSLSTINYTATSWMQLGVTGNMNTELAALYNRVLPVDQQNWLRVEPFDLFASPARNPRVFILSGSPLAPRIAPTGPSHPMNWPSGAGTC